MRKLALPVLSVLLTAAFVAPTLAQQKAEGHSTHHPASAAAATDMTDGEIRNLDMPPMTMVFQVKDADLLDKVKPGDKVRFTVENTGTALVVTAIEAAR